LWLGNILNSTFPYEGVTQLGNNISDLPFLPIYSLPFYLLGNVGLQNIINIIIIILVLWKFTNNRNQLNFALMSLSISVPLFIFLFTHSDHITVAALALLGIYLLNEKRFIYGIFIFSLLIASKAYIWLFIPTTLYYIYKNGNKSDLKKSILLYVLIPAVFIIPFILWNPVYFFTIAPIGVDAAHLNYYFPFSEYIITLGVIIISLLSYYRTNNLYITFLITYLIFSLFLFSRVMLIDTLAIIMVGILYDKKIKKSTDLSIVNN